MRDLCAGRCIFGIGYFSVCCRGEAYAGSAWAYLDASCLSGEDVESALKIVGGGGEMDLDGGFGEASPSHSAQAVAAFPGAEDLFDPASHAVDRLVPCIEASKRLTFVTAPHRGRN